MSSTKKWIAVINKRLAVEGIDAVASFQPAPDDTTDDEIEFQTTDGAAKYPVAIQIGGCSCTVNVHEFDASGEIEAVVHGLHHGFVMPDSAVVMTDLVEKLKAHPPIPEAVTDSKPSV